jgi:hypothetical protein
MGEITNLFLSVMLFIVNGENNKDILKQILCCVKVLFVATGCKLQVYLAVVRGLTKHM